MSDVLEPRVDRFEEVKSCWRNATGERFVDDVEWLIDEVERLRKVKASDDLAYEYVAEMYHAVQADLDSAHRLIGVVAHIICEGDEEIVAAAKRLAAGAFSNGEPQP